MEIKEQIISSREKRHQFILKLLELDENDINQQPLKNKRSIAEIINHILSLDTIPNFILPMAQVLTSKMINKVTKKKIDASDYFWNLEKGDMRSPNMIKKEKLEKKLNRAMNQSISLKINKFNIKFRFFSEYHANFHQIQLKILIDKAGIEI